VESSSRFRPTGSGFCERHGIVLDPETVHALLSYRIRKKAKRHRVSYSFLFMRAMEISYANRSLIDSGIIRPVVDRVFPFESTNEAMAYVERGRGKRQGCRQGEIKYRLASSKPRPRCEDVSVYGPTPLASIRLLATRYDCPRISGLRLTSVSRARATMAMTSSVSRDAWRSGGHALRFVIRSVP